MSRLHSILKKPRSGFTLIEVLVSTALLTLLLVVVASLTSDTASISTSSQRKLTAAASARQVLDRFSTDISTALMRADLPQKMEKNEGNDVIGFYAQAQGYQGDREISRVEYRLVGDELLRGATGFAWEGGTDTVDWGASTFTSPGSGDFEILGRGIIRFEYLFLLKDGTMAGSVSSLTEAAAIIVGVVAIDSQALALMDGNDPAASAQQLADLFPDISVGVATQDIYTQWTRLMNQPGFGSGFPSAVLSGMQVYQRVFPVR